MSGVDEAIKAARDSVLSQFGRSVTYIEVPDGSYNEVTGEFTTSGAEVRKTIKVAPPQPYKRNEVDGSRIQDGDLRTVLSALDFQTTEPKVGDRIEIGNDVYTIVDANPLSGSGELIAYWPQLRKAGISGF